MKPRNTICLWFDKDALDAAQFYAATFPDSAVTAVHKAPADYPGGAFRAADPPLPLIVAGEVSCADVCW